MPFAAEMPIRMTAPAVPQLHADLRQRIIRNEIAPGERLSESEVAAAYAVSRQPVREAFIRLAAEGLVEVRPQRGTFVAKISVAAVMDARFVREASEADIVRLLAAQPDAALDRELARQLEDQAGAARGDAARFIALDETFHRTLARAAGHEGVFRLLEGLKAQMDRVRFLRLMRFPMDEILAQHHAIARAIAAGDPEAAETALRRHLREILKDLPDVEAARPDLFDPGA
ncbi:GntR family transcriptional regulator [Roseivivax sp. CAU 1761]